MADHRSPQSRARPRRTICPTVPIAFPLLPSSTPATPDTTPFWRSWLSSPTATSSTPSISVGLDSAAPLAQSNAQTAQPASRRSLVVLAAGLALLLAAHVAATAHTARASLRETASLRSALAAARGDCTGLRGGVAIRGASGGGDRGALMTTTARQGLLLRGRAHMREAVRRIRHDLTYLHGPDMLVMTMGKAGSSTIWRILHRGVAGTDYPGLRCGRIHNKSNACWKPHATPLQKLPEEVQWRVLTRRSTLRVAVQREPFSRLVSAYKSKFTCERMRFRTDLNSQRSVVAAFRGMGRLDAGGGGCMNVSEFARGLDTIRMHAGQPGYRALRYVDTHIRPQEYLLDAIDYSIVLDVADLSEFVRMKPLYDRLKFRELALKQSSHDHSSGDELLTLDERAAMSFHLFAAQSKHGDTKYIT